MLVPVRGVAVSRRVEFVSRTLDLDQYMSLLRKLQHEIYPVLVSQPNLGGDRFRARVEEYLIAGELQKHLELRLVRIGIQQLLEVVYRGF